MPRLGDLKATVSRVKATVSYRFCYSLMAEKTKSLQRIFIFRVLFLIPVSYFTSIFIQKHSMNKEQIAFAK